MPTQQAGQAELHDLERRNARLMRLLAFVDANYTQKIRLADFAAQEHCSVSYLSRFVKEMLNQTFQEYVETVRFNAACKLMAAGETKMVAVYAASGFSDYRYFSRAFHKRTGLTPEEYCKTQSLEAPEQTHIHRSIHSLERLYSREMCIQMVEGLRGQSR
jgi:AraC-like DNA-binding protein